MSTIIVTGPAGVGKSSVIQAVGHRMGNLAAIDVDGLRRMVVAGYQAPWWGEEGHRQHFMAVNHACYMAKNFRDQGFNTLIVDTLTSKTHELYQETLGTIQVVMLTASWEVIRERARGVDGLSPEEIEMLYLSQSRLDVPAFRIDSSHLTIEQCAELLEGVLVSYQ